jgi:ketosteroid isomerase-like protein
MGTLERLIDDPYFHTNVAGRTMNRAEWLAEDVPDLKPRPTITFDDMKVRVFGDTAVLTGGNVVTLRVEGKTVQRALRFTQVWRRYGDTWRRALFQGTEVPAK